MPYKNIEDKLKYNREWNNKNRDRIRVRNRLYYTRNRKNPEKVEKKKQYARTYWKNNNQNLLDNKKKRNLIRKNEMFFLLGNKCSCGFFDIRALQIDHIKGGGTKERKLVGKGNFYLYLYRTMIKNPKEFKNKYQILCANCNWIKRYTNNETKFSLK